MRPPPLDKDGCVEPHDHEQIRDEDIMLRGIPAQFVMPTPDGGRRISPGAFSPSSPSRDKYRGLSLGAKKVLECLEKTTEEWSNGLYVAVVCVPAKMLRDEGVQIGWDPQESEPSHCNAWGVSGLPSSRKKALQKRLAEKTAHRFLGS